MVYMHFPTHLTDEEEYLQKKYAKLKKKKLALKALRAPKAEPAHPLEEAKKRSYERAADATEEAKKLLKAGAIKLTDKKGQREFKRTKRQKEPERSAVQFQPFQPTTGSDNEDERSEPALVRKNSLEGRKNLYESFISSREPRFEPDDAEHKDRSDKSGSDREDRSHSDREDARGHRDREDRGHREDRPRRDREDRPRRERRESERDLPKKGNTIYVHGHNISEEQIKKSFSNFGNVVNISMEQEKNCGFVTYEKMESSDAAIAQMNGVMMAGIQLKVTMARRQPNFEQAVDPSSATWAAIAASQSQKGTHRDKRELVAYDNDDLFD